ncbi:MAG: alpha/beta hydrolase [Clostridia bacterium]|nr:alpha/beta hydrolase [Clostridia bacterium]
MTKEALQALLQQAQTKELTPEEKAKAPGAFIDLPCGFTHYELAGEGTPCVLVHGYATPYFIYDKLFQTLVDNGYRVLRYDLLGRGLSERVDAVYSADLFARQLSELTDAIFPDTPFHLFGTSMGGTVTATFCAQYPGRAKSVIWLAPAGMDTFRPPFYMKLANIRGIGGVIFNAIGEKTLLTKCASEATHVLQDEIDGFMRKFAYALQYKGFVRCTLSSLRNTILATEKATEAYAATAAQGLPLLCVWGEEDRTMPIYQAERLQEVCPQVQLVRFPGSGHIFVFDEGERTADAVLPFLRSVEASR